LHGKWMMFFASYLAVLGDFGGRSAVRTRDDALY